MKVETKFSLCWCLRISVRKDGGSGSGSGSAIFSNSLSPPDSYPFSSGMLFSFYFFSCFLWFWAFRALSKSELFIYFIIESSFTEIIFLSRRSHWSRNPILIGLVHPHLRKNLALTGLWNRCLCNRLPFFGSLEVAGCLVFLLIFMLKIAHWFLSLWLITFWSWICSFH